VHPNPNTPLNACNTEVSSLRTSPFVGFLREADQVPCLTDVGPTCRVAHCPPAGTCRESGERSVTEHPPTTPGMFLAIPEQRQLQPPLQPRPPRSPGVLGHNALTRTFASPRSDSNRRPDAYKAPALAN
jgi:hypothetical protein